MLLARRGKQKAGKITRENRTENTGARKVPILQPVLSVAEAGSEGAKRVKIGLKQKEEDQEGWEASQSIQGEHYHLYKIQTAAATSPMSTKPVTPRAINKKKK